MSFKIIEIDKKTRARRQPSFHVGFSAVTLSKVLYEQLGKPEYVKFAVDTDARLFGVCACRSTELGSTKVNCNNKQRQAICASSTVAKILLSYIDDGKTHTFYIDGKCEDYFTASIDEGVTND